MQLKTRLHNPLIFKTFSLFYTFVFTISTTTMLKYIFTLLGFLSGLSVMGQTYCLQNPWSALSFSNPIDIQIPPDGSKRLYVVEQGGRIRHFEDTITATSSTLFLDISARVAPAGGEMGLLGLAFHPNYAANGYFYVNYTRGTGSNRQTVISRFSRSSANPLLADPTSELILLTFSQPYSNHNAGCLLFGDDGYLYIPSGDGGSGGDPQNFAQNRQSLLGKMLRIDVDNTSGGRNYSIPPDNPFINDPNTLDEIYAIGLRNPWKTTKDAQTGEIWIGDVGQNAMEEIDILRSGANYGWRILEGYRCYDSPNCDSSGMTPPVAQYPQTAGDRSITGGYVYRGENMQAFQGAYIYGDYVSGRIWALRKNEQNRAVSNTFILNAGSSISSFGLDTKGELLVVMYSQGRIRKLQRIPDAPTVSSNTGSLALCQGQTLTLIAPQANGYVWSTGANTRQINITTPGNYTLRTVLGGCTSAVANFNIATTPAPEPPTIQVTGVTNFCPRDSVKLTASEGFSSYNWSHGAATREVLVRTGGNYTVAGINAEGCRSNPSTAVVVTLKPEPNPPALVQVADSLKVTNAQSGVTYTWFRNGDLIPGENNAFLILGVTAASYTVQANLNGCTRLSPPFFFNPTGLYAAWGSKFNLFPNPATDVLQIVAPQAEIGKAKFQICSSDGKALSSLVIQEGLKNNLQVAHLKPGNYFIKITDSKRFVVKPFLKQ